MHATPTTQAPAAAHAHGDTAALRSLAIDTLCDLMRRGQASDSRRHAATTALRYLSQLDRLAITAARGQNAQPTPASTTPHTPPVPPTPSSPASSPAAAPAVDAPADAADPRHAPASLPTAVELRSLMDAVRDTALTPPSPPDPIVLPGSGTPPFSSLAPLPLPADAFTGGSAFCQPLGPANPRPPRPSSAASLLAAAGSPGPAP
jgi:hypothetical protein